MKVMREERRERMTGTRAKLTREPSKVEVQEALGMGIPRPFILPKMWTVNDFKPTMTANIIKNLRDYYQIPNHIPIHMAGKFEKCYSGKTTDISIYDATFAAGLRLPLMALHHKLANFLGLSVNQIAPNAWRNLIEAEIL